MENQRYQPSLAKCSMSEYEHFDGEAWIVFDMLYLDLEKNTATIAVSNRGKISVIEYDLIKIEDELYFEFNPITRISLADFEEVKI